MTSPRQHVKNAAGFALVWAVAKAAHRVRFRTMGSVPRTGPVILVANQLTMTDPLAVARVAGIAAAKKVPDLLPLAHVIGVHGVVVDLEIADGGVEITATVRTADRTGVEMEALTAVTVAALAVVDMVKGVDRSAEIVGARITAKIGGRSGEWVR